MCDPRLNPLEQGIIEGENPVFGTGFTALRESSKNLHERAKNQLRNRVFLASSDCKLQISRLYCNHAKFSLQMFCRHCKATLFVYYVYLFPNWKPTLIVNYRPFVAFGAECLFVLRTHTKNPCVVSPIENFGWKREMFIWLRFVPAAQSSPPLKQTRTPT